MLKLAYYVELTWLLVDMLSGYLQNHNIFLPGNQTVGALVRVAVVGLFVAIVLRHATLKRLMTLVLLLMCFLWMSVHMAADSFGGKGSFAADAQFHLKLMLPVLTFGAMQVQLEQGALDATRLRRIVLLNAAVLILNVSLGLFGIGFGNYGESDGGELIGSKGFFYAGNEVSATLVAIFALVMFLFRERFKRNSLQLLLAVGVFFVTSLMSLSKTSLVGFLLVLIFVMYSYLSRASKIKFSAALALTVVVTTPWWLPLLQVSLERWEYFWALRPDFVDFITSGRSERIQDYVNWIADESAPWHWLFGNGQQQAGEVGSFENDLLDLTMGSGLLGLVFYGVWAGWAWRGLTDCGRRHVPEGAFTFYVTSMFIVLSVIAGHVVYSATLAPFIALVALTSSRHFPGTAAPVKHAQVR